MSPSTALLTTRYSGGPQVPRRLCPERRRHPGRRARSSPGGNPESPGGGRAALGPGGPPGTRRPGTHRGPRPRPASGGAPGPASRRRRTSLPSGRPPARARGPGWRRPAPDSRIGNSGVPVAAPHAPARRPSATARRPRTPFPAGPSPGTRRPTSHPPRYLLLEPAQGVETGAASSGAQRGGRGSAALSRRRRHCALWRGAGLPSGRRGGELSDGRPAGRHCRSPPGRGRAAAPQRAARGRVGVRMGRGLREQGMAATSPRWIAALPPPSLPAARSRPRPLVRPGLRQARGPAPGAGLGDPGPRALPPPPPALDSESGLAAPASWGPFLLLPKKPRPKSLTSFPLPLGARVGEGEGGHMEEQALCNVSGFAPMNETIKEPEMCVQVSGAGSHRRVQPFPLSPKPHRHHGGTRSYPLGEAGRTRAPGRTPGPQAGRDHTGRTARPRRGLTGPWAPGARTRLLRVRPVARRLPGARPSVPAARSGGGHGAAASEPETKGPPRRPRSGPGRSGSPRRFPSAV